MKTILLPTDFLKHSERAKEFAIEIAKLSNAEILATHAYHLPLFDANIPQSVLEELSMEERENAKYNLQKISDSISNHRTLSGEKIKTNCIAELNLPLSEISQLSKKHHIDLIIMGTEDEDHFLLSIGSTTVNVLDKVTCPVLVVKEKTNYKPFRKIYFAIENFEEDVLAIKQVIPLARLFNSEILLIHVEEYPENINKLSYINERKTKEKSILNKLSKDLDYPTIKLEYVFSDDAHKKIISLINGEPNLFALLKYNRNWLENLFHKSVINSAIGKSNVPLLILHKD
jgi:nucleotide-binding universal stress UspA family protein